MKTTCHILLACLAAGLGPAASATAQASPSWWQRPLLAPAPAADAGALLLAALEQEKARGQLDSAVAAYRRILVLHRERRAADADAARALERLRHLGQAGLVAPTSSIAGQATAESAGATGAGVAGVASRLQLSPDRPSTAAGGAVAATLAAASPLQARRRWLERALRLRAVERHGPRDPDWLVSIGSGIESVRAFLGLRGVPYYVASQLRSRRTRALTPHERLLAALAAEKEDKDFGSALGRYRELVQLSLTGGIATRLSERARQGLVRCQSWQRASPAGP